MQYSGFANWIQEEFWSTSSVLSDVERPKTPNDLMYITNDVSSQ